MYTHGGVARAMAIQHDQIQFSTFMSIYYEKTTDLWEVEYCRYINNEWETNENSGIENECKQFWIDMIVEAEKERNGMNTA